MAFTHIWSLCRHLKNGVYKKKNALDDDFSVISLNSKQVVFSFHTALYLLGFIMTEYLISFISVYLRDIM